MEGGPPLCDWCILVGMSSLQRPLVEVVVASGLCALGLDYTLRPDGRWTYEGIRPGDDWEVHGTFPSSLLDLAHGKFVQIPLAKPRWRLKGTNVTQHTRPPDDLGLRYSAIVVVAELWAWLDVSLGLHRYTSFPGLENRPARRTVRRWLDRALPLPFQQHVRSVLLDHDEPRLVERLFPAGLPPPSSSRRPWRDPQRVTTLHRGLAMLLCGAIALEKPAALLLAEAQRRDNNNFLIG